MNPEIKKEWLRRLRSGEYDQGTEYLRKEGVRKDSYCCLGVLCEMAEEAGVVKAQPNRWGGTVTYESVYDSFDFSHTELPDAVQAWAELDSALPVVKGGYTVAQFNDGDEDAGVEGKTFDEIADLIEESL